MHVAIVTETWPPEVNGVALTVHALARGLVALGHEVDVVRPRRPVETARDAEGFDELLTGGAALPRYPGLRFGLPAQTRLARHWQQRPPDALYVATEGPLGHSALAVARRLGVPACTGFHTRFDDFARHYGLSWLTPLVFAGMRRFHNRADATLVPTRELADFLGARGFRHVRHLSRAVDTATFHPIHRDDALRAEWGIADGALTVVHVGRLAAEKNLDLLVRAFRAVQHARPEARLVIVGDGPERTRLAAAHPDVVFTGVRHGDDLSRHYASADLFLFPSITETFGNVTLEAMASGLPVVAFDYGAAREHIPDALAGVRVAFADDEAFVAAAADLADDEPRREGMRTRARHAVERLDPASVSAHFADLLAGLAPARAA